MIAWEILILGFALGILAMTILNLYRWVKKYGDHWLWSHGYKKKESVKSDYHPIEELLKK